jgi:hypothetical protein
MSVKNRPPVGEPYIWLPRELLASDAWRSAGINTRRFIDFLMLEQMGKGGQENGKLKATDRQLRAFGIGARHITRAIREAEKLGLVDCIKGGMRVATMYRLTWLESHDGTPATTRWRVYPNPNFAPLRAPKIRNLPHKGKAVLPHEGKADVANLPHEGKADGIKTLPSEGKVLLREFLPRKQQYSEIEMSASPTIVAGAPTDATTIDVSEPACLVPNRRQAYG